MIIETLEHLAPEERHRIYMLLRLDVRLRPDWPLEITGVFAEVGERQRRVRRIANFPHLAYKGLMNARRTEETGFVR
jgi:hypothetical protein